MLGYKWEMEGKGTVARIYLNDPHQEYTGNLTTSLQGDQGYLNAQVVWDNMDIAQAVGDAWEGKAWADWDYAVTQTDKHRKELFPSWPEEWDTGAIWAIEGDLKGLTACFDSLAEVLDADISGDDDVFDYWPNTMNMLREFALDLDTLFGGRVFSNRMFKVYDEVKTRFMAKELGEECPINFDEEVWNPNG